MFTLKRDRLPTAATALKGRDEPIVISGKHYVLDASMLAPHPEGSEQLIVGIGCFWGAEKRFWLVDGVITTAVGYSAGITHNPSYDEVCSGNTGHNEVVSIVYDPGQVSTEALLKVFWESHNPTQGMRQGNDRGTQYRSGIYYTNETQRQLAEESKQRYQQALSEHAGKEVVITTEILPASTFYYAEEYHQQYLSKNPSGYCGLGGLGVALSD
jgi:peptide-methionine (S)-S-oxide reductase